MSSNLASFPCYDFSLALNAGYLKEIVPLLVRHNVAANPIGYAIWYDYVSEQNPELKQDIDQMIARGESFGPETSLALFEKHFCETSFASLEKINQQLLQVINQASDTIRDTRSQAEMSRDSFTRKSATLAHVQSVGDVRNILQEIMQETQTLASSSHSMQERLNQANQELEQLRQELTHVKQLSLTDGLTGLLNRRAFDEKLSELIAAPSDESYLCMLDIDHFKLVNDSYGHAIGDSVIRFVASLMKKYSAEHHYVARYGGEELGIIMPATKADAVLQIAEQIRHGMESCRLKRKDNNQPLDKITLSIGIARLQSSDTAESWIVRADSALYRAKQSGRNRIVTAY